MLTEREHRALTLILSRAPILVTEEAFVNGLLGKLAPAKPEPMPDATRGAAPEPSA